MTGVALLAGHYTFQLSANSTNCVARGVKRLSSANSTPDGIKEGAQCAAMRRVSSDRDFRKLVIVYFHAEGPCQQNAMDQMDIAFIAGCHYDSTRSCAEPSAFGRNHLHDRQLYALGIGSFQKEHYSV